MRSEEVDGRCCNDASGAKEAEESVELHFGVNDKDVPKLNGLETKVSMPGERFCDDDEL